MILNKQLKKPKIRRILKGKAGLKAEVRSANEDGGNKPSIDANTFEKVFKIVAKIPQGRVTTYGAIAKKLGITNPRVVGYALHSNSDPDNIPCHRVVNAKGELAGGFAFGGKDIQRKLLESEGVKFEDNRVLLNKYLFKLT